MNIFEIVRKSGARPAGPATVRLVADDGSGKISGIKIPGSEFISATEESKMRELLASASNVPGKLSLPAPVEGRTVEQKQVLDGALVAEMVYGPVD